MVQYTRLYSEIAKKDIDLNHNPEGLLLGNLAKARGSV